MYKKNFGNRNFTRGKKRPFFSHKKNYGQPILDFSKFINHNAVTAKKNDFVPENTFQDLMVIQTLKNNIAKKGYSTLTPIQDKAIPVLLKGSDVVGIANTGTGKTGAFLIPLINKVALSKNRENVLIIAPTRELAIQIDEEFKSFAKGLNIFSVCCVGGASIGQQIKSLRYYNNFIIGTPGRIKDLIERKHIRLSRFGNLVLDEADRMLDMGFIDDMRFIVSQLAKTRQTLLFSATISKEVEEIINQFTNNPIRICVKTPGAVESVYQDIVKIKRGESKVEILHDLLIKPEFNKVLIFGRTKMGVEKLLTSLSKRGFKAESIHGDKNQSKRQRALNSFRQGRSRILIATDVAARGLDISDVSHVINFDLPGSYNDYIHRIGRTGRAGKSGCALTFVES
ncbi:MAG: DEAD/DEAH box helicase [bacterium]|nr:DEAD/DEAH box helicase [bacterium]